jgi:hypothetical protein
MFLGNFVIPAKAGIHKSKRDAVALGHRFRGDNDSQHSSVRDR